ncbi:hypothetical protein DY000_02005735 [Brassica cretica]|uniref:Uncharacterized protein n=1 Tax=Brassica cretica TaxID=69181 RepID=A0ABQ7BYM0_BRACR|nr:hypothetical protein DY000_02005735 [Brassica cretica]
MTMCARQVTVSPEHTRERPFRLNLHKKAASDLKLKGKTSDLEEVSDEGSSARTFRPTFCYYS